MTDGEEVAELVGFHRRFEQLERDDVMYVQLLAQGFLGDLADPTGITIPLPGPLSLEFPVAPSVVGASVQLYKTVSIQIMLRRPRLPTHLTAKMQPQSLLEKPLRHCNRLATTSTPRPHRIILPRRSDTAPLLRKGDGQLLLLALHNLDPFGECQTPKSKCQKPGEW